MSDQEIVANDSKRLKISYGEEQDMDQRPIADSSNGQTTPKLFKLNLDCFDEIFVYLSKIDLLSLGATCKAMQKVVREYFKEKFPNMVLHVTDNLSTSYRFGTEIKINGIDPKDVAILSSYSNAFAAINKIKISTRFNENVTDAINEYLHELEVLDIHCHFQVNLYARLLKWCKNLKTLYISGCYLGSEQITKQDSWMCQKYPKLEHFELNVRDLKYELMTFLEQNSHLKIFGMKTNDFWLNRNKLMNLRMQLDLLKIRGILTNNSFVPFCELLNKLYEKEFYRRLHLQVRISQPLPPTEQAALSSLRGLEKFDTNFRI